MIFTKLYPKYDLGKSESYPFEIAFIYHPRGIRIVTGSMDKIQGFTKDWPTCHACVYYYRNGFRHFDGYKLFGRQSVSMTKRGEPYFMILKKKGFEEKRYRRKHSIIFVDGKRSPVVIGEWRRFPNTYLRQLKEFTEGCINKKS